MPVHLSYKSGKVFVGMDLLAVCKASVPSEVSYRVEPSEETLLALAYYSRRLYTVRTHERFLLNGLKAGRV